MIDPYIWAQTPGLGRAPLLPDPVQPVGPVADPRQDIVQRLIYATGGDNRVLPGDRPVGALVRDVATMTRPQLLQETAALGKGYAGRAPAVAAGVLTGLPGAGLLMGGMARRGMEDRQVEALGEFMGRMPLQTVDRPITASRSDLDVPGRPEYARQAAAATTGVDAYEAGRQAARGYQPERESRGGGDRGYSGADRSGSKETTSQRGGLGGV